MVASINKPLSIKFNILMFSDQDLEDIHSPDDDALVIKVQISNNMVSRVLVDIGAGISIFFKDAIERMRILDIINKSKTMFHTFIETLVQSFKMAKLAIHVYLTTTRRFSTSWIASTLHNAILGSNWLYKMKASPSYFHQLFHYLAPAEVKEIMRDQAVAR
ncbi:hypothetical protein D8674_037834 [Pyrus ussuriensis x Pyrus communis]|uniref:Uncharacterized protein n=1 Tax=Pyrus ussuriensis x Pyrus communis TaxID=2448454 RepID=A0A5N5HCF7_9ROSA|nr:hypothetical protein D8674_037834 [Pyrus ussuriensis x Pyrus communis]